MLFLNLPYRQAGCNLLCFSLQLLIAAIYFAITCCMNDMGETYFIFFGICFFTAIGEIWPRLGSVVYCSSYHIEDMAVKMKSGHRE